MKRLIKLTMVCMTLVMFVSCERVAPNYAGVLMGNRRNATSWNS